MSAFANEPDSSNSRAVEMVVASWRANGSRTCSSADWARSVMSMENAPRVPSLAADDPFLKGLARQLAHEARRLHEDVHAAAVAGHHRKDEVELLLGAGDGDVEQPPLFLDRK